MSSRRVSQLADQLPTLQLGSRAEWERWLERWHDSAPGVWLALAKRGSIHTTLTYAEALDGALCFGWIDGQKAALDEHLWLQRFTPRSARSRWSRINRDRAQELERSGRMRPAGAAQLERARADGRWDAAYAGQRSAEVPDDLRVALLADPRALEFFDGLDSANRYAILYRIEEAKRPATRAQRIARYVSMLAAGERLHP
ncbi:MAG: YdeI/OmpD-associated family protein [Solirubrobacteraceae bacterium]